MNFIGIFLGKGENEQKRRGLKECGVIPPWEGEGLAVGVVTEVGRRASTGRMNWCLGLICNGLYHGK